MSDADNWRTADNRWPDDFPRLASTETNFRAFGMSPPEGVGEVIAKHRADVTDVDPDQVYVLLLTDHAQALRLIGFMVGQDTFPTEAAAVFMRIMSADPRAVMVSTYTAA